MSDMLSFWRRLSAKIDECLYFGNMLSMSEMPDDAKKASTQETDVFDGSRDIEVENAPAEAKRIQAFAQFFKSYMSVSTLLVAALPIPITAWGAIPTFRAQTKMLATYTPML